MFVAVEFPWRREHLNTWTIFCTWQTLCTPPSVFCELE